MFSYRRYESRSDVFIELSEVFLFFLSTAGLSKSHE